MNKNQTSFIGWVIVGEKFYNQNRQLLTEFYHEVNESNGSLSINLGSINFKNKLVTILVMGRSDYGLEKSIEELNKDRSLGEKVAKKLQIDNEKIMFALSEYDSLLDVNTSIDGKLVPQADKALQVIATIKHDL